MLKSKFNRLIKGTSSHVNQDINDKSTNFLAHHWWCTLKNSKWMRRLTPFWMEKYEICSWSEGQFPSEWKGNCHVLQEGQPCGITVSAPPLWFNQLGKVIRNKCTRWVPGSRWTCLRMVAADWLTLFVLVSGDPTCTDLITQPELGRLLTNQRWELMGVSVTSWYPMGALISDNQRCNSVHENGHLWLFHIVLYLNG